MQRCFCGKRFGCRAIRVETSSILAFFAVFLQKKRKISGRKLGVIEGKYAGLGKAPGEYLTLFYQFRNCGCASEKRFSSGGRAGWRLCRTVMLTAWVFGLQG